MTAERRLVVCDDEADFRFFVRKFAESKGFLVREVADSAQCVAEVLSFRPDIVVLDVIMPAPDGIEVVHGLAAAGYKGRVIITSGYNPHFLRAASIFGANEGLVVTALSKPVSAEDLDQALA